MFDINSLLNVKPSWFFLSPLRAEQQKLQERLAVLERLALEHADSQKKSRSTKGDLPKGEHI